MISRHQEERPYSCTLCTKTFKIYKVLKKHMKNIHKTVIEETKCSYCDEIFPTNEELEQHITSNHYGDTPYSCKLCESRFAIRDSLSKHVKSVHGEKIHKCTKCDAKFSLKRALRLHIGYDAKI